MVFGIWTPKKANHDFSSSNGHPPGCPNWRGIPVGVLSGEYQGCARNALRTGFYMFLFCVIWDCISSSSSSTCSYMFLLVLRPVLVVQQKRKTLLRNVTFLHFTYLAATNHQIKLVIRSISTFALRGRSTSWTLCYLFAVLVGVNRHAPTSPRSIGFCVIWDCISSSSSSKQHFFGLFGTAGHSHNDFGGVAHENRRS